MTAIVTWVHDEMLRPALISSDKPSIFVFDEDWIREERLSLKRIVFMYECLLEMPNVEIHRGDIVVEVRAFAAAHGASSIESQYSPLPRIKQQGDALGVRWLQETPFVDLQSDVDLRRFSRYWRQAERHLF